LSCALDALGQKATLFSCNRIVFGCQDVTQNASPILAHQYFQQLEPDIRHAVLGNTGTVISFRVGPEDAAVLAKEFQPRFDVEDLLNLPNWNIYLKLMISGAPSQAFSAKTIQ
jgi:hypothetical protein